MLKEYIAQGKNVDVAIKNGLLAINKSREDVDIKILETGGLFKKAKVCLSYEEIEVVETPVANETEDFKNLVTEEVKEEKSTVLETEKQENITTENKDEQDIEETSNEVEENIVENKEEKETTDIASENNAQEESDNVSEIKETKIIDTTRLMENATEFLKGIVERANLDARVSCSCLNNELHFNITGENVGKLIGHRGETLNALQYLLGCVKTAGEGKIRIYLDIEGYKEKRAETLVELANKMADKAEEIERNVHLDPMSAYERRIIHTALQDRQLVETESTGEGEKRHVVIKFKR